MSKYHFLFEDRLGKRIVEYDTDIEPPVMGDIIRLERMINDKNVYVVFDRWFTPVSEGHVEITFTLDLFE